MAKTISWVPRAISVVLSISIGLGPSWRVYAADADSADDGTLVSSDSDSDGPVSTATDPIVSRGFLVRVQCSQDAKLNGDFRVLRDGKLQLPYNVSVTAAGTRLSALQKKLTSLYRPYFKGPLEVRLNVQQKRFWVDVVGLVQKPGALLLKPDTTLGEALAMAEVRTEDLPVGYVRVEQGERAFWVKLEDYFKGHPRQEINWQGGEKLAFQVDKPSDDLANARMDGPSTRNVQVVGEVKNPGDVSFQRQGDGYYYLLQRGGPTRDSDLQNVELLRKNQKTGEHKRVAIGDLGAIKSLQESDVLLVHSARPSRTERALQNTALVASILSTILLVAFVRR